jgi:glycosyltransferase involved in cell wall biosynthesis
MSKQSPLVSIITPSYNQGAFVEATILSVLEQDYSNLEYLVVDGASTDETQEILRRYRGRLRWISEPDEGQAHAINKGFARTRGEILGWLNSDDVYTPGAISAVVEYLVAHPEVMLVYGDANFIDADGVVVGPCAHVEPFDLHRLIHHSDFIVQPATFFRRSAFEAVGRLDESLHWAMDYDLWLKIGRRYQAAYLPRLMANSRWFGANKTALGGQARLAEIEKVARRHGGRGLPAYFCLEAVALNVQEARQAARRSDVGRAGACLVRAATALVSSRPAIRSLVLPKTWRVIGTRQARELNTTKNGR